MGLPVITYTPPGGLRTINFPEGPFSIQRETPRFRMGKQAASNNMAMWNLAPDGQPRVQFRLFDNIKQATLKRNLYQWFEWAQLGNIWYFSMDSTLQTITTLQNGVNAGLSSVNLVSATGISIGGTYTIRSKANQMLVNVTNIVGNTVTLAEPLDYTFPAGSRFRDWQYWPGALILDGNYSADSKHPIIEQPPLHFAVTLQFREYVNNLGA